MAIKIDKLSGELKKLLNDTIKKITSGSFLDELGEFTVNIVRKRTKLGKGVDKTGGQATRFKPYSNSYITQRKRLKGKGQLEGTPTKVSLTQTGEMLDKSLGYTKGDGKLTIEMDNDRNTKKAEFVSEDRPFMNLSKAEIAQIEKKIRDEAKKLVKIGLK